MRRVKGESNGFVGYHHMSIEYAAKPSSQSPILSKKQKDLRELEEEQDLYEQINENEFSQDVPEPKISIEIDDP